MLPGCFMLKTDGKVIIHAEKLTNPSPSTVFPNSRYVTQSKRVAYFHRIRGIDAINLGGFENHTALISATAGPLPSPWKERIASASCKNDDPPFQDGVWLAGE
jgi:hypothetical protein